MSIRTRIFFVFVAAVIAGFSLLAWWISRDVADRYSESFEEIMVDTANLLAEIATLDIAAGDDGLLALDTAFRKLQLRRFSARIYELEKTSADIQVYVTDHTGTVIYDSDNGKAVGEDYSEWNDVYRTLRGEYGARATRVAEAVAAAAGVEELTIAYVAAPIYRHGEIAGVLTVAKPKSNIDRFVANAKSNLLLAVVLSVAMALLLGLMLYIWVSRPLQSLVDYANSVSRGERVALPHLGDNEVGKVGDAMESMRRALEDKQYVERYVQSLTHELKSPLTAIHAAAELLNRDLPADRRTQFTQTILKEADRLNDFASQLLKLAALEKQQRIDNPEAIRIDPVIRDIIESHRVECESREITVVFAPANSFSVYGDRFLIRQAIDNLLRNAIAVSPRGGDISVETSARGSDIDVGITDAGPGIPESVGERVFERFFSLPHHESGRKGTGLGLNFAREVAQLHHGRLTLQNRDPGLCACLSLPAARQ